MPGRIAFYTTADGASSVTERLRIDKSGAIGIAGANYGTSGQVLASGGSGAVVAWSDRIVRDTSIATTSGTAQGFTTIPSWAKKITLVCDSVSTSGNGRVLVQIGTGGSYVNTGYQSSSGNVYGTNDCTSVTSTTGFIIDSASATTQRTGAMTLHNISGNVWVSTHVMGDASGANMYGGGRISLAGAIDRIRITTVAGTETFDSGSINLFFE